MRKLIDRKLKNKQTKIIEKLKFNIYDTKFN